MPFFEPGACGGAQRAHHVIAGHDAPNECLASQSLASGECQHGRQDHDARVGATRDMHVFPDERVAEHPECQRLDFSTGPCDGFGRVSQHTSPCFALCRFQATSEKIKQDQ